VRNDVVAREPGALGALPGPLAPEQHQAGPRDHFRKLS
jgi:hypothetical protein